MKSNIVSVPVPIIALGIRVRVKEFYRHLKSFLVGGYEIKYSVCPRPYMSTRKVWKRDRKAMGKGQVRDGWVRDR